MKDDIKNFQDDIPSIPFDIFEHHCLLVFALTLMEDATEKYQNPEVVGEPLRLGQNFIFPLEQVTGLIVLRERMSLVSLDKFGVPRRKI